MTTENNLHVAKVEGDTTFHFFYPSAAALRLDKWHVRVTEANGELGEVMIRSTRTQRAIGVALSAKIRAEIIASNVSKQEEKENAISG